MICAACGSENRPEASFCSSCGSSLARVCPNGHPVAEDARFCDICGAAIQASEVGAATPTPIAPAAERRLVSVLFADLVGFTAASEGRDAEETRELLTRYFDTCRTLIERYGGTVEKFIGDAVMAVWGAPVAQEDDPERAVRAALELVAGVPVLDQALQVRVGVVTGEAAVTLGAEGQGMVAGDLVNTASRVQGAAEAGMVLVGETTRRGTEAAIAYADAGEHALKGKANPVRLWRAERVVAARGGAQRSAGLEPPFVGRERELRLVKELLHACAEERRSQLVSVLGIAGIGKSRLGWEFEKYVDGLAGTVWWHRGRCLAYGQGVTYWALAEMVRMRCGIAEGEEPDSVLAKLQATLAEHVQDAEERQFVEPRLAHLLGLENGTSRSKEELFGAWRVLFERLADLDPVVLVFEDLQWADASLVEFIAYLLEWSRSYPILVLSLARPELQQRHPEFGHGSRQATLTLEPLTERAMLELLDGFVPGLPPELRGRILDQAEGVPLYAVETVRMLIDRGLLAASDGVYRPTRPVEELEVPETLHGLIAARLDGLAPEERRLLQDASVLGKTFAPPSLAALAGVSEAELEPLLAGLVRKEVLGVQADPRSPERGQYGFLQDLVRRVAYETLARRERKGRHLAAASQLEASFGSAEGEIVEVLASHFVAAFEAEPDADDAAQIRARAHELLAGAGRRAGSLGATGEAMRYYEQAAAFAETDRVRADLLEHAGRMAISAAHYEAAQSLLESAGELLRANGDDRGSARVSGRLAFLEMHAGRVEQAIERLRVAFEAIADEPDADAADVAGRLAAAYVFAGDVEASRAPNEYALRVAQALRLPEQLCRALTTRSWICHADGRMEEALALIRHTLSHALEHDLGEQTASAYGNLSDLCFALDRYDEALEHLGRALAHTRRLGLRGNELFELSELTYAFAMTGRWDEALDVFAEIPEDVLRTDGTLTSSLVGAVEVLLHRGAPDKARELLALYDELGGSGDANNLAMRNSARVALLHAEGRHREALETAAEPALSPAALLNFHQAVKQAFVWAVASAFELDDLGKVTELIGFVDGLPPGHRPPFLEAHAHRARARLEGDEQGFKTAAAVLREYGIPFWLAVTQLEHGEWLAEQGRGGDAAPIVAEARATFERLRAQPWLERLDARRLEGVPG